MPLVTPECAREYSSSIFRLPDISLKIDKGKEEKVW
jgi:hypothetical protein